MKYFILSFLLLSPFSLTAQTGTGDFVDMREQIRLRESQKQLDACQSSISGAGDGKTLDVVRGVLRSCRFREVNPDSVLWSKVSSAGRARSFNASVEAQRKKIQEERERQNRDDEVTVTKQFYRFDQVVPTQVTSAGSVIGEEGLTLASSVTQVMLYLQRSDDLAAYANKNYDPKGPGVQELMELANLAEMVTDPSHNCREVLDFRQLAEGDPEARAILWSTKGKGPTGEIVSPLQIIFGFKDEEDLNKLDAFRWQKDGKFYYMFRHKTDGEDRWALGEYAPETGSMRMRHYRIVPREQTVKLSEGLVNLPDVSFSTRSEVGSHKSEISGEVGLSIDSYREGLPWGGEVTLPTGSVTISQIKAVNVTESYYTENQMQVQHDGVRVNTSIAPLENSTWQASFNGHKRIETGEWSMGSQVRVYNLVAGYQKNSEGGRHVSMAVMGQDSFIQYDTNTLDSRKISVGKMLGRGNRAAVTFGTDLEKKSHEIQVVVFF